MRAAGTWITTRGLLPPGLSVEAGEADELLAAAMAQLDDGADFVKLYLDGPDPRRPRSAPTRWPGWSRRCTRAAQGDGARDQVARHQGMRVRGVDSIEHGFELDADIARQMAEHGCALVTTMTVLKSWLTFSTTTTIPRFAQGRARIT